MLVRRRLWIWQKHAMKLPNYEHVVITQEKVVEYLISDTHRDGRHKAAFFKRFCFTVTE